MLVDIDLPQSVLSTHNFIFCLQDQPSSQPSPAQADNEPNPSLKQEPGIKQETEVLQKCDTPGINGEAQLNGDVCKCLLTCRSLMWLLSCSITQ